MKKRRGVRWRVDRKRWEHRKYFHGKIYSGLHKTEAAARQALAEIENRVSAFKNIPQNSFISLVNDFLLRSKTVGKSPERIKALVYNFKRFIVPFFGEDSLPTDITAQDVEDFVAQQKERRVKNITIWHYVVDLSALFNYYIKTYKVPIANPVKNADLRAIRQRKAVKPPFTPATVDMAVASLNKPGDFYDRLFIMFAACTGARRGEINRTKWTDLYLDDVENAWYRIPGTKTDGSYALNPIPPVLAIDLVYWRNVCKSDLVFAGRSSQTRGKQILRRSATFKKVTRRCGIKLTTKDLRDYYCSMVDTMDPRTLKDLMRHSNLSTTTTYSRRREELMREAVKNLGVNFGVNRISEEGLKQHENTFHGNQFVTRKEWLNTENDDRNVGGGGRTRTVDSADMSRGDDSTQVTKH